MTDADLREALQVLVITDRRLAAPRSLDQVVRAAVAAGARAIQVRDKGATARELVATARRIREISGAATGTLLFVNDRLDVALAAGADGVHLGSDDIPVAAARAWAPPEFLVGYSTDDPADARRAQDEGADYIGCGAVYATTSKNVGDESIGTARLDEVARAVTIPVLGIGGVTVSRAAEVAGTAAAGVAVIGAVMGATDPGAAVEGLLAPFLARRRKA